MSTRTIFYLLPGLLLLGGCQKAAPPAASPPPEVTVAKPVAKKIIEHNEYTGRMAAIENVSVRPRVSGYIVQIPFKEGNIVKKDDLLFVIDPRPYQASLDQSAGQLKQAQAQQELNNRNFTRAETLNATKVSSKEEFDQAATNRNQADAAGRHRAGRRRCRETQPGVHAGQISHRRADQPRTGHGRQSRFHRHHRVDQHRQRRSHLRLRGRGRTRRHRLPESSKARARSRTRAIRPCRSAWRSRARRVSRTRVRSISWTTRSTPPRARSPSGAGSRTRTATCSGGHVRADANSRQRRGRRAAHHRPRGGLRPGAEIRLCASTATRPSAAR